jgi:hypothetical protein
VGFGTPGKGCPECNPEGLGLVFLLVGWGMMTLLDMVDETYLLGVVPRIVEGFQKKKVVPLPLIG